MQKPLKIAGIVLAILVALLFVVALVLPFLVDANDFKPRIEAAVEDATGRSFEIPGDIRLSLFPWLGAELGTVRLGEAPGFGEEPFATVERVQVRVKLLPLLSRDIQVGKVVVDQPRVRLLRNAEGRANWDDLVAEAEEVETEPEREPADEGLPDLSVEGIEIRDAHVYFQDLQANEEIELSGLNLELGRVTLPADFPLSASGRARVASQGLETEFQFNARIAANPETEQFTARDARLNLTARGPELPISPLELRMEWAHAGADLQQDTAELRQFALSVLGVNLTAEAEVANLAEAPQASGRTSFTVGDLAQTAKQLGDLLPEDVNLSGQARGDLAFTYDQATDRAAISEMNLRALGVDIKGHVRAEKLASEPAFEGRLDIAEFSPGQLLVRLGQELPPMRDGEALESMSLGVDLFGTENSLRIENLVMVLDQSRLTGRVEVADIERQALRFTLAMDAIDADRYLPPDDEAAAEELGAEVPLDQIEIPADLIKGLDIDGNLTIGKLKAFGFNSTDVRIGLKAANDMLRVHPAEAKFYGGGYRGDIRLDARGDVPAISLNENVDRIQLAPLMQDVFETEQVSGTAQLGIRANARGNTIGDLRQTLDGDFNIDIADGAIEGFNLWESIREAYEKFRGRDYDASQAPQRTEFAELSASGRMEQGVIHNNDLLAKLPFLNVNGNGRIDIAEETLDYTLEVRVLRTPDIDGTALHNTTIPVRLTGPLTEPRVRPDVRGVLEARAREELDRREQEARERIERKEDEARQRLQEEVEEEKKRARDKLRDRIKGLTG